MAATFPRIRKHSPMRLINIVHNQIPGICKSAAKPFWDILARKRTSGQEPNSMSQMPFQSSTERRILLVYELNNDISMEDQ